MLYQISRVGADAKQVTKETISPAIMDCAHAWMPDRALVLETVISTVNLCPENKSK